ncbi:MAG: carbohydrate ABC transporter permease, partial [Christensenellaceae bacterium]
NQQKLLDNLWGWLFCSPLLIGTIVFVYTCLVLTIVLSFTNYNMGTPLFDYIFGGGMKAMQGDAFYWYKYIFTDSVAWKDVYSGLFNAIFYMIGIPIGMILSMFFAVCMTRDIKGANFYRVIYYIPSVASTVAITFTFQNLFKTGPEGVINQIIIAANGGDTSKAIAWLAPSGPELQPSQPWAPGAIRQKWIIILMSVWKGLGGTIVLYIAGLSGVNASHKEAASIDGANGWVTFWKIMIPQLWPTIFYNIVTSVIGGMQIYAEPDLLFRSGGTTSYNIYTSGYVGLIVANGPMAEGTVRIGYASALGMVLAIIIMILTLIQFYLDSKNDN